MKTIKKKSIECRVIKYLITRFKDMNFNEKFLDYS